MHRAAAREERHPPQGWLSPWISESHVTPDLLQEAGYPYLLNWCHDDQPIWLRTRKGELWSIPYPQEINDIPAIVARQRSARRVRRHDRRLLRGDARAVRERSRWSWASRCTPISSASRTASAPAARAQASARKAATHLVDHRRRDRRACLAASRRHCSVTALILPLTGAAAHFPPRGALIGLDLGTKTIGVAVSDPDRKLAAGVTTIARTNFTTDAKALLALAGERAATGFGARPAHQHGRVGGPTRAVDARLRAQLRQAHGLADRTLGRAAVHHRGRTPADLSRRQPQEARRRHRPARRRLHLAGRARSPRPPESPPGRRPLSSRSLPGRISGN